MKIIKFILIIIIFQGFLLDGQNKKKGKPDTDDVQKDSKYSEYIYNPMGRRDPFIDLLKVRKIKNTRTKKEGIAGLYIEELDLEGIILYRGKYIAGFKGPDGKPYSIKKGDDVYDGKVIDISATVVTFKKILTVALGGKKQKLIYKRLNPEEEDVKNED